MAKTFGFGTAYCRITANGGTADDPITFEDIYQYFKANPLSDLEFPRDTNICSQNELCEQNASDWANLNGLDTPADDAVDYNNNSYSISAEVTSVPTPDTSATKIERDSETSIYVRMPDTSAYSVNEHIMIKGTTNFDGIYLINYIHSSYLRLRVPKSVDDLSPDDDSAPADETSLTVLKPLSLIWNDDRAIARIIPISNCQKMKFSVKTDSTESSPVCSGIALRNMYREDSADEERRNWYGASLMKDFDMTSTWEDYEVVIKDEFDLSQWVAGRNGGYRGYWQYLGKVALFFDGLAVGDTVWIDGVRFNCERNPTKDSEHSKVYRFPVGLNVQGYFKDHGFNFIYDCLDTNAGRIDGGQNATSGLYFASGALGNIELGDYSGDFIEKDGGAFIIDNFSHEDNGDLRFNNCYFQGITLRGLKGVAGITGIRQSGSVFKGCNFQNLLNFTAGELTLNDCFYSGGRYFILGTDEDVSLNNVIVTGTRGQVLFPTSPSATAYFDLRNLKVINQDQIIYSYNGAGKPYGYRLIDLDVTECTNPYIYARNIRGVFPTSHMLAYSFNLKTIDQDENALQGVSVTMKDKDSNEIFSVTTDSDGEITEQIVNTLEAYSDGSASLSFYMNAPDTDWTKKYPFSLVISKKGYQTYEIKGFTLTRKTDWTVILKKSKRILQNINGGLHLAISPDKGTDSKLLNI